MADLRIVDAPEIPTENITGEEKLPTGGNGNYSISLDSLADYTKTKKDLADNTSVDGKVSGVRQELDAHIEDLLNPHQVTKGQIGLGNVDNTADADKPVSNSTQAAIISAVATKADKTYVDNQLTLKANKVDVYTKQESSDLVDNSISTALTPINTSLDLAKRGVLNRYDSALTYNSGERIVLANGDIVKSTIDGNTNDPNVDMTGWSLSDAVKVANQFNADDTGLRDSTLNIAELLNPAGKFIKAFTKGVYLIDEMIIPPDTIIYANGATFKRAKGTNKPLITVGLRSILIGAIVDGDEDNIGAQLWNGDQGIKLDEGALAVRCVAKNCHGHGFTLSNDAIAIACNSYNNGREGGNGVKWGNWGDGFNMTNSNRAQLLFCRAWGSYRTGIVGTTSAGAPNYEPNPLLSVGISLVGCKAWDNNYSDVNFEGCSKVQATDLDSKSGITFRITPDMTINGLRGAIIDADGADNATINNVIIDRDNTSSAVYISGKNPKISNITVRGKSGITQSGVAVQVITPDKSGSISNIQIDRAFNAVRTNVKNFTAFEYSNITNTVFNYDGRFFVNSGFISAIDGRVSQRTTSLLIPSSGSWLNGDLLINGGSSGDYAVQCVTSGQATDVAWSNGASIALNAFIYNGVNVYKATTGGVLGTTAPNHTSGTVANGTAQLEYVSARAEFKTIAYKTDPIVGVSAIVPASITNANDTALIGKFYWVESVLTNMPLPTSGVFTKANIETYNAYRLSGNNALTQEVNYPYLNEKWVRAYDGGIGSWSLWTLVHTKNSTGATANRPSGNVPTGFDYFDTTLNKPIYLKSAGVWVDATGVAV